MAMRTSAALSVVAVNQIQAGPSVADQIRLLQAQAKALARDQIGALETALLQVERLSAEIANGGEAYPVGIREIARRLAEDCEASGNTLKAIAGRA
ncbi:MULTISPECIES: hypothetical protein [Phenylobacterium]|uniref:Uncharacterized protein n=1 Tax=Phenylobacterium koreense TaxID=266125 RepID=A0ABV2EE77_9CAUL